MKKITILCASVIFMAAKAQVGVGTTNPQGVFNIDGAEDNNATGIPELAQQANDVVVTLEGKVGIGTSSPSNKLVIDNGTTAGAIKIIDGTQGADKVLMSDASGVATWRTPASAKPTVVGIFPVGQSVVSDGIGGTKNTGVSITLSQGKWAVNAGLTIFDYLTPSTNPSLASRYWLHAYLSSSTTTVAQTGFTHLGPAGNNTSYASVITSNDTNPGSNNDRYLNFLSGSSLIDVTDSSVTLYLLLENFPTNYWTFPTSAWENYFYAIPLN